MVNTPPGDPARAHTYSSQNAASGSSARVIVEDGRDMSEASLGANVPQVTALDVMREKRRDDAVRQLLAGSSPSVIRSSGRRVVRTTHGLGKATKDKKAENDTEASQGSPLTRNERKDRTQERLRKDVADSLAQDKMNAIVGVPDTFYGRRVPVVEWWDEHLCEYGLRKEMEKEAGNVDVGSTMGLTVSEKASDSREPLMACRQPFRIVCHPRDLNSEEMMYRGDAMNGNTPTKMKLMVTKEERRKIKRKRKRAEAQLLTDKIRMGLVPAPPPKVKIGNMHRVLGDVGITNPSEVEELVRGEEKKRLEKHMAHNAAKKLSASERKAKVLSKLDREAERDLQCAVFYVRYCSSKLHICTIERFCTERRATGVLVLNPGVCVVVCEGGRRVVSHFRSLMLRRVAWSGGDAVMRQGDEKRHAANLCRLLWTGPIASRCFTEFKVHRIGLQRDARAIFAKAGCEQYWVASQRLRMREADADEEIAVMQRV